MPLATLHFFHKFGKDMVSMVADPGVGSLGLAPDAIETQVDTLSARAGAGGIYLVEADALSLGTVGAQSGLSTTGGGSCFSGLGSLAFSLAFTAATHLCTSMRAHSSQSSVLQAAEPATSSV
jgi:hypothetical protein